MIVEIQLWVNVMSHSVTMYLVESPKRVCEQDRQGYEVRGSIRFFDRKIKAENETEYLAVVFSKSADESLKFERELNAGAIVKIFGNSQRIVQENERFLIEIIDSKIEVIEGSPSDEKENTNDELIVELNCEIEQVNRPARSNVPPGYFIPDTSDFFGEK